MYAISFLINRIAYFTRSVQNCYDLMYFNWAARRPITKKLQYHFRNWNRLTIIAFDVAENHLVTHAVISILSEGGAGLDGVVGFMNANEVGHGVSNTP